MRTRKRKNVHGYRGTLLILRFLREPPPAAAIIDTFSGICREPPLLLRYAVITSRLVVAAAAAAVYRRFCCYATNYIAIAIFAYYQLPRRAMRLLRCYCFDAADTPLRRYQQSYDVHSAAYAVFSIPYDAGLRPSAWRWCKSVAGSLLEFITPCHAVPRRPVLCCLAAIRCHCRHTTLPPHGDATLPRLLEIDANYCFMLFSLYDIQDEASMPCS